MSFSRGAWVLCLVAFVFGCLPNPESVRERRENFDRGGLMGDLIVGETPAAMDRVDAVFGGRIKLLGAVVDPSSPEPGDRVTITFYWSALVDVAEDYQVFVHGDSIGAQASRIHGDHYPAKGKYPTDVWQKEEIVVDPFSFWIPPGYGPKKLGINVGLYKGNYRVPLSDKGLKFGGHDNRSRAVEIHFK